MVLVPDEDVVLPDQSVPGSLDCVAQTLDVIIFSDNYAFAAFETVLVSIQYVLLPSEIVAIASCKILIPLDLIMPTVYVIVGLETVVYRTVKVSGVCKADC